MHGRRGWKWFIVVVWFVGERLEMGEKEMSLTFDREEGEPMGVHTDENLMVTRVQDGTVAEGKIQLGDVMVRVNEHAIKDKNHFFQLLQRCFPTQLTFQRSRGRAEHLAASQLPHNLEKMINRRSGYEYPLLDVDCRKYPGKSLGLTLTTRQNKVFVTGAKDGTISGLFFRASDRILIINGAPVSDKEVARALIIRSGGIFQAVLERAQSEAAKKEVKQLEESYRHQPVRPPQAHNLPPDVETLLAEQRQRLKNPPEQVIKPILRKSPSTIQRSVSLSPAHQEVHIVSDVPEDKKLRIVPRQ